MDQLDVLSMKISMDIDSILETAEKAEKVIHLYEMSIYNQGNGYNPDDLLYAHGMLEKVQKIALNARMLKNEFKPEELDLKAMETVEQAICVKLRNSVDSNDRILREKFPSLYRRVEME